MICGWVIKWLCVSLTEKLCSTDPLNALTTRIIPPFVEMRICFPSLLNLSPVQSQARLNLDSKEANGPFQQGDIRCYRHDIIQQHKGLTHSKTHEHNDLFYLVESTKVVKFNGLWFHSRSKYQPIRVEGTNRFPQWISQTLKDRHTNNYNCPQ